MSKIIMFVYDCWDTKTAVNFWRKNNNSHNKISNLPNFILYNFHVIVWACVETFFAQSTPEIAPGWFKAGYYWSHHIPWNNLFFWDFNFFKFSSTTIVFIEKRLTDFVRLNGSMCLDYRYALRHQQQIGNHYLHALQSSCMNISLYHDRNLIKIKMIK